MLQFCGSAVTSDAGLLACHELDDVPGLMTMARAALADRRTGKNGTLVGLLWQSVFGRLAGYEDVNDAECLRHDVRSASEWNGLFGRLELRRLDLAAGFQPVQKIPIVYCILRFNWESGLTESDWIWHFAWRRMVAIGGRRREWGLSVVMSCTQRWSRWSA